MAVTACKLQWLILVMGLLRRRGVGCAMWPERFGRQMVASCTMYPLPHTHMRARTHAPFPPPSLTLPGPWPASHHAFCAAGVSPEPAHMRALCAAAHARLASFSAADLSCFIHALAILRYRCAMHPCRNCQWHACKPNEPCLRHHVCGGDHQTRRGCTWARGHAHTRCAPNAA